MNIILTRIYTYTDTEEHLLWWAKQNGYGGDGITIVPDDQLPDLQTWCEDFIDNLIRQKLTAPIQRETERQSLAQVEQAKQDAAEQVLDNLTIN